MAGAEVLIIGGGGREAALQNAISDSNEVDRVVISSKIEEGLEQFSGSEKPFVVIGPEAPLVAGVADDLRADGYTVFGASKDAARYEASKSFAVTMMRYGDVAHPQTEILRHWNDIKAYIESHDPSSYVIKADGLAGGKGVVLPETIGEAMDTAWGMKTGTMFDGSGKEIINFAERHSGPEVSAMIVVGDNDEYTILPIAQDHKRLMNGDQGPNTGGMGAYAPVPESILSQHQYGQLDESVQKTLAAMRSIGMPFERGLLYGGFMLSDQQDGQPVVIEYNVRFGDPETQVILPILRRLNVDVYRLLRSAAEGALEAPAISFSEVSVGALTICLAAKGYPDSPEKGAQIYGLDREYPNVTIQKAAVTADDKANGGRVIYATATGETLDEAAKSAYAAIGENGIHFDGMQYRDDIGWQARTAEQAQE